LTNAAADEPAPSDDAGSPSKDSPPSERLEAPRWQRYVQRYQTEYRRSVQRLILGRTVFVVVIIPLLLLLPIHIRPEWLPTSALLVGLLLANLAYAALTPWVKNLERFVLIQAIVDIGFEAVLIYLTGGLFHVPFALLHVASIIVVALLVSEQASIVCASICSVLLSITAALYFYGARGAITLPFTDPDLVARAGSSSNVVVNNLIAISLALHFIGYLAGQLPYQARRVRILYEEILSRMQDGVVAIDNAGRIVYVNKQARAMLGWEAYPEIVTKRFSEVFKGPENRRILEILTAGEDLHGEIELPIDGRGIIPLEIKTSVLRDERLHIRGVVGILADLSAKRKIAVVEQRLDRLRSIEHMSVGIAHEVRNPLASIRGAMQELRKRSFADEDDRTLADIVLRESDRLDAILDGFMQYARMKPLALSAIDIVALVKECVILLNLRADAKNIEIQFFSTWESYELKVDGDRIKQVLLNLGVNALQALNGSGLLSFRIGLGSIHRTRPGRLPSLYDEQPSLQISVEDDGPGISKDIRSRLFTPFFSTKPRGMGLGLALAQKILDMHDGDLSCETPPTGGTLFLVKLPLTEEADEAATPPEAVGGANLG
jgi:two-component system, NtrC family, sensor histidine kinase PilS